LIFLIKSEAEDHKPNHMWIEQIFIESFGAYNQLLITNISPRLSVILGRNEAGKSTILEFVRSIFFGFKTRTSRVNSYETPNGVPRKGRLTVNSTVQGKLRIERIEKRGLKEGNLIISDEEGNHLEPSVIPIFHTGMDRGVYESLFAFDLDQIRHLDHENLRRKILAATVGSFDVSPLDVRSKLGDRLKTLGKKSQKDSEALWAMQAQIKDVDQKLSALAEEPARYSDLKKNLEVVEMKRKELSAEIRVTEGSLQNLAELLQHEDAWTKLMGIEREVVALAKARQFPVDGILRLDQLFERRREAQDSLAEAENGLQQLKVRLKNLNPDRQILEHSRTIETLHRQSLNLTTRPSDIEQAAAALAKSKSDITSDILSLGPEWDEARVETSDPSIAVEQKIREFAASWNEFRTGTRDFRNSVSESSDAVARIKAKTQHKTTELNNLREACSYFLEPAERDQLVEWRQHDSRIRDIQDRLLEKKRIMQGFIGARQELDRALEQVRDEDSPLVSPALFSLLVILLGAAGIGMIVAGLRGTDIISYAFTATGLLIFFSLPWMVRWKILGERHRLAGIEQREKLLLHKQQAVTLELAEVETDRRTLLQELEELKSRCAEISDLVLNDPSAGLMDIMRAESKSSAAEEPFRRKRILEDSIRFDDTDLQMEKQRLAGLQQNLAERNRDFEQLNSEWKQFLADQYWDEEMEPEAALESLRRLRELKNELRRVSDQERSLFAMKKEWEEFVGRVLELGHEMDQPVAPAKSPLDQTEEWSLQAIENKEALAEKKALLERFGDNQARLDMLVRKIAETNDQINALIETAKVDDEESFRNLGRMHERYQSLEHQRAPLVAGLISGLNCRDENSMRARLQGQDWQGNRRSLSGLREDLVNHRKMSDELAAQSGRLENEITMLENEEEMEMLLAEKEELLTRLNHGIKEWTTLKIATGLLDKTLRIYESEKQPKILEHASHIFGEITGNAYRKILLPLDSERVKVERMDGTRVEEDHLSRGTLEQVYLSLRLAHLEIYRRGDSAIPLMMDDVLVNFDMERARRTAKALIKFSTESEIQVLFFTCHSHVAALFAKDAARITLDKD
jgi:uncharacterized protein YhaN